MPPSRAMTGVVVARYPSRRRDLIRRRDHMRDDAGHGLLRQPRHRTGEPSAATTAPESSRIGAATHTMPISLSSSSIAQPRWRTAASALRKRSGLVTVLGVCAVSAARHHAIDHLLRLEREDRLPLRRRMRGLAHAEVRARANRMRALEIVDVHDLAAVKDRKMHALVDGLAQRIEIRPRFVRHLHAPAHQRAEPEQARRRADTCPLSRSCSSMPSAPASPPAGAPCSWRCQGASPAR